MADNGDIRVLIIDDEELISWALARELQHQGYQTLVAATGEAGMRLLAAQKPQVVLLDYRLPDADGLELLQEIKTLQPQAIVMLMTAYGGTDAAVRAIKLGASDYITKPVDPEELLLQIRRGLDEQSIRSEVAKLRQELGARHGLERIVGASPGMRQVLAMVQKVAASKAPSVLVHGESGTGKEMVANAIHYESERRDKPLVAINCGALPAHLLESELFGHEAGAFTDAKTAKKGQFELADGGTLVLDEISEMEPALHVKLLRVLETRAFKRVGGVRDISIDVRIVAITNRNLEEMIAAGAFRQDLYYRLNLINIALPPLRAREGDILLLAEHFIASFSRSLGKHFTGLDEEARAALTAHHWPGNVRELRNIIERAMILEEGPLILCEHLPAELRAARHPGAHPGEGLDPLPSATLVSGLPAEGFPLEEMERQMVVEALHRAGGNQVRAARWLSVSRDTLRYKMRKHGLLS